MNIIIRDPEVLGGMAVFYGTRVPVKTLFDMLEAGESIAEFMEDFPTVTIEQVRGVLRQAEAQLELAA
jgi:hypothetical protein